MSEQVESDYFAKKEVKRVAHETRMAIIENLTTEEFRYQFYLFCACEIEFKNVEEERSRIRELYNMCKEENDKKMPRDPDKLQVMEMERKIADWFCIPLEGIYEELQSTHRLTIVDMNEFKLSSWPSTELDRMFHLAWKLEMETNGGGRKRNKMYVSKGTKMVFIAKYQYELRREIKEVLVKL